MNSNMPTTCSATCMLVILVTVITQHTEFLKIKGCSLMEFR